MLHRKTISLFRQLSIASGHRPLLCCYKNKSGPLNERRRLRRGLLYGCSLGRKNRLLAL